ncbi:hypothetical protein NHQ30_011345 [Ciborinia camelliae]|nr:hypothetical protein NHQ30_011345 [Ciborinia camelliae]
MGVLYFSKASKIKIPSILQTQIPPNTQPPTPNPQPQNPNPLTPPPPHSCLNSRRRQAPAPLPTLSQTLPESRPLGQRTMNTDTIMSYDDADDSDSDSDGNAFIYIWGSVSSLPALRLF